MGFNTIVVVVAVIILVLLLVFIGFAINEKKHTVDYPPVTASCPDYWASTSTNVCENTQNLGTCAGPKDFSDPIYQGDSGNCERSKWAKNCGIVWDGITNNIDVCNNKSVVPP